ncbi:hypothetical protein A4A49_04927 [Nicotiana attenuata]|uniref:5'-3' exonuclease alpha-helical arch N-terminal domain-containing protein n=1 Tax=Nicotiana attenuata TaxID=49451 RepID=A0A1J6IQ49_NICAT|nr:hypothetical protein A4A49_04927 [Nicotiana attenuata]
MACHQLSHCLRTLFHLGSKNIWVALSPSGNFTSSRFRKLHPICSLSTSPLNRGYCRAVSSANNVESEQVLHRNVPFDFPHTQIKSPNLDTSNGRVMLIDGTSIIYRAYYRLLAKLHHGHLSHADGNGDWVLTIFTALSLIIDVLEFLPSHVVGDQRSYWECINCIACTPIV